MLTKSNRALHQLGRKLTELYDKGAFEEALKVALNRYELAQSLHGDLSTETAAYASDLGQVYVSLGNGEESAHWYRTAFDVERAARGENDSHVAKRLADWAHSRRKAVHFEEAVGGYRQALEMIERAGGGRSLDAAETLNGLALAYHHAGRLKEAEGTYKRARAVASQVQGNRGPLVGTIFHNLGEAYSGRGIYLEAVRCFRQALTIRRLIQRPTTSLGNTLDSLAEALKSLGRYQEAERLFQEALEIRQKILGRRHEDVARTLDGLTSMFQTTGRYAEAETLIGRSMAIRRELEGEASANYASSLRALADLRSAMGDYQSSERLYRRSLEIERGALGPTHVNVAFILHSLAILHNAQQEFDRSIALHQEALDIYRLQLPDSHPDVLNCQNGIAVAHKWLGNFGEAGRVYRHVLRALRASPGTRPALVASTLNNLAELSRVRGRYKDAERLFKEALGIYKSSLGIAHPDTADCASNLARLYAGLGQWRKAVRLMLRALACDDALISQLFQIGSERQRLLHLRSLEWRYEVFLSLMAEHLPLSPTMAAATLGLVLRRKGLSAEVLAVQQEAILSGRYPALRNRLRQLFELRSQISLTLLSQGEKEVSQPYHLDNLYTKRDELEAELGRQIPEMVLGHRLRSVTPQTLARALPAGFALIDFVRYRVIDFSMTPGEQLPKWKDVRYLALILHARRPRAIKVLDLGSARSLQPEIRAFLGSVVPRDLSQRSSFPEQSPATAEANGTILWRSLFEPIRKTLGRCRRLFIVPDGDLYQLPFEILPQPAGRRLIQDFHISYLAVGRDLLRINAKVATEVNKPLVAADPDFDLVSGGNGSKAQGTGAAPQGSGTITPLRHFQRLHGTRLEGKKVATTLKVRALLDSRVLEARLKAVHSPSILHIATHGFFFQHQIPGSAPPHHLVPGSRLRQLATLENPLLRSGLVMAGANTWLDGGVLPDAAEDGLLTAEDVSSLDLRGTQLVVLSACQTGLGDIEIGEGVFGLRRAFMLAGAKTLVTSLWKIPDHETMLLMISFYQHLLAGKPRAAALRQAQLELMKQHPEPYYWGAFICQGAPGPLHLSRR